MSEKSRKIAFEKYEHICAYCGFGIEDVIEAAHIDGNTNNDEIDNLVILCPTCHRMLDIAIIDRDVIKQIRDRPKKSDWSQLYKDAHKKRRETMMQRKKQINQ